MPRLRGWYIPAVVVGFKPSCSRRKYTGALRDTSKHQKIINTINQKISVTVIPLGEFLPPLVVATASQPTTVWEGLSRSARQTPPAYAEQSEGNSPGNLEHLPSLLLLRRVCIEGNFLLRAEEDDTERMFNT